MRKFFLSAVAALFMSANAMAIVTTTYVKASDKTAINNAFNAEIGAGNTHIVVLCGELDDLGNEKTVADASAKVNLGTTPKLPKVGTLIVRSNQTDIDNLPCLELEVGANPVDPAVGYPSIVFENVALDQRTPLTGAGYIISNKNADNYYGMDSVVFRHCDIKSGRAIYREENTASTGFTPHHIKKFIFENNKAHQCNILKGNNWRPFYFVAIPDELYINGNMFYDMPYAQQFITFHKTAVADGTATSWYIYNNTFMMSATSLDGGATQSKAFTFVSAASFLDPNTTIDIYNNLFLGQEKGVYAVPTDIAEGDVFVPMEATEIETETGVTKTGAQMVYAVDADKNPICNVTMRNNLMSKYYQDPDRGSMMDLFDNLNPEVYSFSFDNCFKPELSNFTQLKDGNALYTAGASAILDMNDEPVFEIPTIVGAPMMYVDEFPQEAKLKVQIAGTYNGEITYTVAPEKEVYKKGDEVTITLSNDHNSYYRTFNKFEGWSGDAAGTEKSVTIKLEEAREYNVTATYSKAMDVVAAFDFSTVTKNGNVAEYVADLGAQMGTAKVFAMVADTTGIGGAVADRQIQTEAVPYVAGNFQTRPAKFGEDPAEQQMAVISRRTASNVRDFNRDYAVLQFSTKGLGSVSVEAYVGTDNNASKNQKVYYSLDNENYTEIADAAAVVENGKWTLVKAALPAAAENKETVYVKFQGEITGGDNAENCAYTPVESAFDPSDFHQYDVFEYMGNILVQGTKKVFVEDLTTLEVASNKTVYMTDANSVNGYIEEGWMLASDAVDNITKAYSIMPKEEGEGTASGSIDGVKTKDTGRNFFLRVANVSAAKFYFSYNNATRYGKVDIWDPVKGEAISSTEPYTPVKNVTGVAEITGLDPLQEYFFRVYSPEGDLGWYAVKFTYGEPNYTPVEAEKATETIKVNKYTKDGKIIIVKQDGTEVNVAGIDVK